MNTHTTPLAIILHNSNQAAAHCPACSARLHEGYPPVELEGKPCCPSCHRELEFHAIDTVIGKQVSALTYTDWVIFALRLLTFGCKATLHDKSVTLTGTVEVTLPSYTSTTDILDGLEAARDYTASKPIAAVACH